MDAFPWYHSSEQHVQTSPAPTSAHLVTPLEEIWQPLFEDGKPTPRLSQFLRGIASHIIETYEPKDSIEITPPKMLRFFEETKVNDETYPWHQIFGGGLVSASISVMYRKLRCEHHIVQTQGLEVPNVPGLTPSGFATFLTCLIQARPDQSFGRLSEVVNSMSIANPDIPTERFPRVISRNLFPARPDPAAEHSIVSSMAHEANLLQLRNSEHMPWLPIYPERQRKPYAQSSFAELLPSLPPKRERKPYFAKELTAKGPRTDSKLSSYESAGAGSYPGPKARNYEQHRQQTPGLPKAVFEYDGLPHSPTTLQPLTTLSGSMFEEVPVADSDEHPFTKPTVSFAPLRAFEPFKPWTNISRGPQIDAGVSARGDAIISGITSTILGCEHVRSIVSAAIDDPDIGKVRFLSKIRRLLVAFGAALSLEAKDESHVNIALAVQAPTISNQIAQSIVSEIADSRPLGASKRVATNPGRQQNDVYQRGTDASGWDGGYRAMNESLGEILPGTEVWITMGRLILDSKAYHTLKANMLEFAHKRYERRIFRAIQHASAAHFAVNARLETIRLKAREISWVPLVVLSFSSDHYVSIVDRMKGLIEDGLKESWIWWPLGPRLHHLKPGFCSLQWTSACLPQGKALEIVMPMTAKSSVEEALRSAPAYINTAGPFRPISRPSATASSSVPIGTGFTGTLSSNVASSATSSSQPVRGRTQQQSVTSQSATAGSATQQGAQTQTSRHVRSRIYICVQSGSRRLIDIDCTKLKTDVELFAAMKTAYNKARGWPRLWFSVWRYDCCEFVKFFKYGPGRCGRQDIGFPECNDQIYDFAPRYPSPPPPIGPVLREEFHDHYYSKPCPSFYDWRRYQLQHRFGFSTFNDQALNAMPKRNVELELQDGKREHFFGLYAKEQRCFIRVFAYACLFNIPGVLFFFLWLFQWDNGPDLQNASVPVMLSLSLTIEYAAVIFGTREQR